MNASEFSGIQTAVRLDFLLDSYAKTWTLSHLWLWPFVTLGPLGFLLNSLSFAILRDCAFKSTPIYAYLRVYALNSALICLVSTFAFAAMSTRLFAWSNSYSTHFYHLFVYTPVANTGYFYGTFLDIVVTLDRIANFNQHVRGFLKYSVKRTCMTGLLFCVLIEFAYYFEFVPSCKHLDVVDQNGVVIHGFTLWFIDHSDFAESRFGKVILFLIYAFRDVFLMLVEIGLNLLSAHYLRVYVNERWAEASSGVEMMENEPLRSDSLTKRDDLRLEVRASVMVIALCLLSIGEHALLVVSFVHAYYYPSHVIMPFYLYLVNCVSMMVKHAVNFFLFVAFNRHFRQVCARYLNFKRFL
jgi:hypothetical protein